MLEGAREPNSHNKNEAQPTSLLLQVQEQEGPFYGAVECSLCLDECFPVLRPHDKVYCLFYVGPQGRRGPGCLGSGREREVNPFGDDDDDTELAFGDQENTCINFDAYEDIPMETSWENVPPPMNTFAAIDLGEALNQNIRRCKYLKPTPVQRHAIPISIADRDLMACAQTGSGKAAAFCFPIIMES
ncbi:DEAD-box ATP-dependent RNA helicase 37-like [Olea europaea subsp. europaea]|uniref:DEAD-box ATP-dependent RNA helicase 37-like n=1 Tax=Olea europaea subsp. europaea TaxID=158383 RepID=A0A8S0PH65_OLEEU|nr:DEAD-box ATP-dependent RNA helicase 37-like [Olea europaea subsp. europaea]